MIVQTPRVLRDDRAFTKLAQVYGRKTVFAVAIYLRVHYHRRRIQVSEPALAYLCSCPDHGFCQLSLFAGFAIYLPELFPSVCAAPGTSFCYT